MRTYDQYCGLALALDRVGDRWTLLVVRELLTGPKRFSDLRAGLPGVATNLLSDRLKSLESEGVIERAELPPPAASAVYRLTDHGRALEEAVHAMLRWGGRYMAHREPDQAFRPHWLAVALGALLAGAISGDERLAVAIELPEGELLLDLDGGGVRVSSAAEAGMRLRGTAECILGLAAGALDWPAALAAGLEVRGSQEDLSLFRTIVERSAGHR